MDLSGINEVMNRIADIEYMVGMRRRPGGGASFQSMLDSELKANEARPKSTADRDATAKGSADAINEASEKIKLNTNAMPDYAKTAQLRMAEREKLSMGKDVPTSASESYGSPAGQMSPTGAGRDSTYADAINQAAQEYGVDPKLVAAVAEVESGFNQDAVSGAGAVGVMQLMPETAATLGVNPYDATQNIEGGAKYLGELMKSFGGDVRKAVAAYNAGPQAVRDYNGVPPYGETEDYVDSVLDLYR